MEAARDKGFWSGWGELAHGLAVLSLLVVAYPAIYLWSRRP
jgi:hypothetical protein